MNVFDELNGYDDPCDELAGIGSSFKKAFKKVTKIRSKIAKKILPSEIRRIGRDLDKSGVTKIAAGAALIAFGGPAVIGGLKSATGIAAKGLTTVKTALSGIKLGAAVKGVGSVASTAMSIKNQQAQQSLEVAQAQSQNAAQSAIDFSAAIGASPKFAQALHTLRAQGYTDEQILQHWRESKSYYMSAVPEVAAVVEPQIYSAAVTSGMNPAYAAQYAQSESYAIADQEVKKVQSGGSGALILGAISLMLFLN